ncbi:hypothetical protein LZZ85_25530 [Terrimonas sp. NA20]|uniref:Cytochrome B n=1 Tax=Terrimonas ginsenosidimutans TaxID=2908004 RepID=A0ABS9KZE5_9BACT|nr:hypothetical protein [Terrimonas ginsenosidimutans]MCG2617688.1 hypothetical protein [Terrimonas ginsenosidimutans]
MATGMLHLHNLLRWVVLILLLVSIFKAYTGWQQKRSFTAGDRKVWLFTLISSHINLLIGLFLLFLGKQYGILKIKDQLPEGISIMSNKPLRFFWIEHPVFMIIAIILVTAGYKMAKKPIADELKFKRAFWLFFIALLAILVAIPWPFREVIGRPLFPGMH